MSELAEVLDGTPEVETTGVTTEVESPPPGESEQTPQGEQPTSAEAQPEVTEPTPEPQVNWEQREAELNRQVEGLKAAAAAERHKRQELEQAQEKPEFWENPEQVLQEQEQRFNQKLQTVRIDMAETYARQRHDDFDQVRDAFIQMGQENPVLFSQMNAAEDPAEYAYQTAKAEIERKEFGSIAEYKASLEAQAEQKAEERAKELAKEMLQQKESIPGSITDIRGATGSNATSSAPLSLSDILK